MSIAAAPVRDSFIGGIHATAGARTEDRDGRRVVVDFGAPKDEKAALPHLALADLSALPRIGYKGADMPATLKGAGVDLGEVVPNRAVRQGDGSLAALLSMTEVLVADAPAGGSLVPRLRQQVVHTPGRLCYPVMREDASFWFVLTGAAAPEMMAKLCGVDLRDRAFADLAVAQTTFARITAVVVCADAGGVRHFHLFGDSASAGYAWRWLVDAGEEFGLRLVGLSALET